MKQAQKQAYAKHRSNITNNRFNSRKRKSRSIFSLVFSITNACADLSKESLATLNSFLEFLSSIFFSKKTKELFLIIDKEDISIISKLFKLLLETTWLFNKLDISLVLYVALKGKKFVLIKSLIIKMRCQLRN